MAKRRINAKNIIILGVSGTIFNVGAGLSGGYLLDFDPFGSVMAISFINYLYLGLAAFDGIRDEMGYKSPASFLGVWGKGISRRIPVSSGDRTKDIFMFLSPADKTEERLEAITVVNNNIEYTFPLSQIEDFVRLSWRRQRSGISGLSRTYWTRVHRPRMKTLDYNMMISLLLPYIVDRKQGKSGTLLLPPTQILRQLV